VDDFSLAAAIWAAVFGAVSALGGGYFGTHLAIARLRNSRAYTLRLTWTRKLYLALLHYEDELIADARQGVRVRSRDEKALGERVWELIEWRHVYASDFTRTTLSQLLETQVDLERRLSDGKTDPRYIQVNYIDAVRQARMAVAGDAREQLGLRRNGVSLLRPERK
jgi:hypothetical protein